MFYLLPPGPIGPGPLGPILPPLRPPFLFPGIAGLGDGAALGAVVLGIGLGAALLPTGAGLGAVAATLRPTGLGAGIGPVVGRGPIGAPRSLAGRGLTGGR